MKFERVSIIGAGALGLYFEQLLSAHAQVQLISRESAPKELAEFKPEMVFICVKAHQLRAVSEKFAACFGPDSLLLLCCNGLGMYFQLATDLKTKPRILRLLPNVGVQKDAEGKLIVSGAPEAYLASTAQDAQSRMEVEGFLQKAGWKLHIEKDIATAEWKKLLTNIVVNSLATICDAPNGIILSTPQLKDLAEKLLAEVRAVALADGFELASLSNEMIFAGIANHSANICSTLIDIRAGRPTEIDFILGRFLRLAKDCSLPTPISSALYALLKGLEQRSTAKR